VSEAALGATGLAGRAGGEASAAGTNDVAAKDVGVLANRLAEALGGIAVRGVVGAVVAGDTDGAAIADQADGAVVGDKADAQSWAAPGYGPQIAFEGDDGRFRSGVTPLLEYGLLKVHGVEAAAFLQAQLTNDVASMADGELRLAGYCSVKGRLMASFWVWRDTARQAFWLACSRDIAAATAKRLGMFVLRAKVRVEDVSGSIALLGILRVADDGPVLPPQDPAAFGEVPLPPVLLSSSLAAGLNPAAVETAADVEVSRALQPVAVEALDQTLQHLKASGVRLLSTQVWRRLEVLSGVARINAANRELFVPQMVNFELVGGVSFKKGCYPGQEVVARSQYLGKLKRRMFLGVGAGTAPPPGVDVQGAIATEPVGQVVMAASLGVGNRFAVLFESLTAAVAPAVDSRGVTLRIGQSPLSPLPLPYPVPVAAASAVGRKAAAPDAAG